MSFFYSSVSHLKGRYIQKWQLLIQTIVLLKKYIFGWHFLKDLIKGSLEIKVINMFIQLNWSNVRVNTLMLQKISISNKSCCFYLSVHQRILKKLLKYELF